MSNLFLTSSFVVNTSNNILNPINSAPNLKSGQFSLGVSDGSIPGTIQDNLYLFSGGAPIDLTSGASAANIGTGAGIFSDLTSGVLNFRSLQAGTGISVTTSGDNVVIENTGAGGGADYEFLNTSDSVNPNPDIEITDINVNSNSTLTLPNPATPVLGQKKKILISSLSGELILNITTFVNGSSLTFTTAGMSASFIWSNTGWIISNSGAILN